MQNFCDCVEVADDCTHLIVRQYGGARKPGFPGLCYGTYRAEKKAVA